MVTRGTEKNREQNLSDLVDQFAYHADEMAAQATLLIRIPEAILTTSPIEGMPSIRDRYMALLVRERQTRALLESYFRPDPSLAPDSSGNPDRSNTPSIVREISEIRLQNAELLRFLDTADWAREVNTTEDSVALSVWIYRLVLRDAEDLKAIGEVFFESPNVFSSRV